MSLWTPLKNNRVFFFLWIATLVSNIGTWMHDVGAGYLATTLTDSAFTIALMQTAHSLPAFFLLLPSGALADILDRRLYLLTANIGMAVAACLLGILTLTGIVTIWSLLLLTLIMGIGTAEELALAEVKADEAMTRTAVEGSDSDTVLDATMVSVKCPYTGHITTRERTDNDPVVWTTEAFDRLRLVPLIARPLARNTVERFAREHDFWRVTTMVMDENKQAMIEADEFDMDTMLVMFRELQTKQIKAQAEGVDGLTPEMRRFIEEAKAQGVTRCPIRDVAEQADQCPVDISTVTPAQAKEAVEQFMAEEAATEASD